MDRGQMNPVFLEEAKNYMEGPTKKMTSELGIDTWEEVRVGNSVEKGVVLF